MRVFKVEWLVGFYGVGKLSKRMIEKSCLDLEMRLLVILVRVDLVV